MKGFLYGSVDLSVHRSARPFHKVPFYEVPYLNKGSQKPPQGRIDGRMVEPSHRDARTDEKRGSSLAFIRSSKLISSPIFKTTDQQTDQPLLDLNSSYTVVAVVHFWPFWVSREAFLRH